MTRIETMTRHLYNALLQQRQDAYRLRRISVTAKMQYAEMTALRKESFQLAFFQRVKHGDAPGFPRFRATRRWRQVEFPHGDRALEFDAPQRRLRIPNVGWVKLRKGRVVPAHKRAWLVCKRGRWYAQFEYEREIATLAAAGAVGLDRGVAVLLATSNGDLIENPRHINAARLHLERAQRILAKLKRRGKNRRKAFRPPATHEEDGDCENCAKTESVRSRATIPSLISGKRAVHRKPLRT
ncbi:MAG: RNA-guided endonuclease InsQ/TnpB family protein [Vulcanimicrobiaceae bacterium]